MIEFVYQTEKEKCYKAGITKEQFIDFYKDWNFERWPGCIVFHKGPQFHIVATEKKRWANKRLFNETLGNAIKEYGYVETIAHTDDEKKFAERLGFEPINSSGDITVYEMYGVKYGVSRRNDRRRDGFGCGRKRLGGKGAE